jgi:uncharacterized protein (DUF608 family)
MKRYTGEALNMISYPLGGIGAGMFCLEGSGMLSQFSLRNEPAVDNEPNVFSAVCVRNHPENLVRVLEGQVPRRKIFGSTSRADMGNGLTGKNYGLPRMKSNDFTARFPFAEINLQDDKLPLDVKLVGYSPFLPLNEDDSSLPAASLEYIFTNNSNQALEAVYYFNAFNFMKFNNNEKAHVYKKENGFILAQLPQDDAPEAEGYFYAAVRDNDAKINTNWFDGGWFDILTMLWNDIRAGVVKDEGNPGNLSPGGSIAVPFVLKPGEQKKIELLLTWYVPTTKLRHGYEEEEESCSCSCSCGSEKNSKPTHKPWYAGQFTGVEAVMNYFSDNYDRLYRETKLFSDTFLDSTLPDVVLDSVSANLTILKSPTVLRQTDGRIWAWEGCCDTSGCCTGSCTHVWNYAQAMCHLFPALERSLRQTEFNENQNEAGHQEFRASLPIRKSGNKYHAASDGQLGGIMKMYREWRISGDTGWLESYYEKIKKSLDYCISTWDKNEEGVLKEPHHNTYDIEFWGADGMCTSFYLGALTAFVKIGEALGKDVDRYRKLYDKGKEYMETKLFNGEYFYQETEWETLHQKLSFEGENEQCVRLLKKEGPKYQYGTGCISDGVLGAWLAKMCGLGEILDTKKVKSHLLSVYRYNFKPSLIEHENPQRPGFAVGDEGGLLLCSWPKGGKPSLPFVYSDEVWTGIEHHVASHLASFGYVDEGLEIEQACRDRYDGIKRNPFNEYECGHWYARAMSSYGFLQCLTGVRYDAVDRILYVNNSVLNEFRTFLCTAGGYGTVEVRDGQVSVNVVSGEISIEKVIFENTHQVVDFS